MGEIFKTAESEHHSQLADFSSIRYSPFIQENT